MNDKNSQHRNQKNKDSQTGGDLPTFLLNLNHDPANLDRVFRQVHEKVLSQSPYLNDMGNFTKIGTNDLARMFQLYDQYLLNGLIAASVTAQGSNLEFVLSRRLTRSGGQTKRTRPSRSHASGS